MNTTLFSMCIGSILLAAGGSTRLGSPKQLLPYEGQSLLRRAASTLLATGCRPAVAVLGSRAGEIRDELAGLGIAAVENPAWERGMGSSLRLGLEFLLQTGTPLTGVLVTLCDQPLVTAEHLRALLNAFTSSYSLAAAAYGESVGVPAVFGQAHFAEILALPDQAGAKAMLMACQHTLARVPMPQAATDIDTREQYDLLGPNLSPRLQNPGIFSHNSPNSR